MYEYRYWLVSQDRHVAILTLNRPDEMNSLVDEMLFELRDIVAVLRKDKSVWVLIVQGSGKHFCAGMDLPTLQARLDKPEQANREWLRGLQQCLDDLEALEKPTIAKLSGFCIGGGLILALCCDFRIASERTIFSFPEVKLGVGVVMGTQRVTRVAGLARTKELILLGKRFKSSDALEYGLVDQVVAPDELDAAVDNLAAKFEVLPPRTVGIAKRIINEGYHLSVRESQDLEIEAQSELLSSPDLLEALESYVEKRQPRFIGE